MKKHFVLAIAIGLAAVTVLAQAETKQMTFGGKRDCDPTLSPDGDSMAFASNRTGEYNIFVYSYEKKGVSQLTQSDKNDRNPSWSADGKKIVFDSKRTGKGDIYEVAADGSSGYLQLTDGEDIEEQPLFVGKDGLLFSKRPKGVMKRFSAKSDIVFMDRGEGGQRVRVLAEGETPRLSPDNKTIVFTSNRTKNDDIWLMNKDGGLQTQLTTDEKDDREPAFSPDGKQIVFASKRAGNFDIWVMNADGSNKRQLTTDARDENQPCWSPGGYIYYTVTESATVSHIYRMPAP